MTVQARGKGDLRGLMALVGILGALIVVGTAVVIGVVIHRIYDKPVALAPGMIPGLSVARPASGLQMRGEHIAGIAGAGGEVAIWVTGPGGDRVLLLDPATGKIGVAFSAPP